MEEENKDPLPNSDEDLSNNSKVKSNKKKNEEKNQKSQKQRVREKPICTICEKPFSKLSNMKAHRDKYHAPPEIKCDICGKMMYKKDQLKLHRANKHSNKKQFYCKACKGGYKCYQSWKEHQDTKKHQDNQKLANEEDALSDVY